VASLPAMSSQTSRRARPVIAIDGPAGAGKSTLARALARALGLPYINTGLMYRALASRALERGVDPDEATGLAEIADGLVFTLSADQIPELLIDGEPPGESLADPRVEAVVSAVARHPEVRAILRGRQRALGEKGSVMEGRDIGTVVVPGADVKIFLSAASNVRVGRRLRERVRDRRDAGPAGVVERDARDRQTNPLEPAPDAHVLDSTRLGKEEVFAEALRIVRDVLEREPR
jgi:cytidylate kinase